MLVDQTQLRIPGPTPIPPSVQRAMNQPMIGHRDQETKKLLQRIQPKLRPIFGTKEEVLIIAGSGTAGLETAVVNTVNRGDDVLVLVTGAFGERFAKICQAYGMKVHRLEVHWGQSISLEQVESYLKKNSIKAVFATYCETSTGVLNPIQQLAKLVHQFSDALLIVDGVSALGAVEVNMDDWGIDILVTGSQKALMLPPGLTFVAVSQRAWNVINKNENPRFYLHLQKYRNSNLQDSTPFTPALSLLFGLEQSLQLIETEGLRSVYSRHQLMMNMIRRAFEALEIPLLTDKADASPTVTAIKPDDFHPDELRQFLKEQFHLILAGGQAELKGKIFRIGHMGYCSPADILQTISCIEIGLLSIGKKISLGTGVQQAQKVFLQGGNES